MENRPGIFLLMQRQLKSTILSSLALCFLAVQCNAEDTLNTEEPLEIEPIIEPQIKPRPVKPPKIDVENIEMGLFVGILNIEDFGSNQVLGVRAAYHTSEDIFIEATYGESKGDKTSYERLTPSINLLTEDERDYKYYNISLGFNVLPGEAYVGSKYAFYNALYIIGGVGNTEFAADDRRTINFGVGYRVLLNDWLALHVNARNHMFDIDLFGRQKTNNNLEFSSSVTTFF